MLKNYVRPKTYSILYYCLIFFISQSSIAENKTSLTKDAYLERESSFDDGDAIVPVTSVLFDTTNPTAICQDITIQLDAANSATIIASDIDNGSFDTESSFTLSIDLDTFDCSHIGDNTVTLTVTDTSNNSATCTATVTVQETTIPTAICKDITVSLGDSGTASISPSDLDGGSSDNCGGVTLTADKTGFTCDDLGAVTVTLTATDGSGNTNSCVATVTVIDTVAPVIVCPDNITVNQDTGICGAAVTFTTPVDGSLRINTGTLTAGPTLTTSGGTTNWTSVAFNPNLNLYYSLRAGNTGMPFRTYDDQGNTLVTNTTGLDFRGLWWNPNTNELQGNGAGTSGYRTIALDGSGYATNGGNTFVTGLNQPNNQSNGTYDYHANEIIFYHSEVLYRYDMEGNQLGSTTIVNFPEVSNGDITTRSIGYTGVPGAEIVIYSELNARVYFIDKATATYNGDFLDMPAGAPTPNNYGFTYANGYVFLREDSSADSWVSYQIVIDDRLDNCNGTTITQTAGLTSGSLFPVGTSTVEFTATDAAGNTSICSFDITVNDMTSPTPVCQDITVQLDASGNVTITDAQIDNGSADACGLDTMVLDINTFDCTNIGTNTVELTVTDVNGNSDNCTATVTVEDNIAPIVVCQDVTVQLDATGNVTIAATDIDNGSSDACGINTMVLDITDFDCTDIGDNTVELTVTDVNGNTNTCMATVTIESPIEIDIQGNGISIANGDATPDTIDDTKFASVLSGGSTTNTFTIDNSTGTVALDITNVVLSGAQAGSFALGATPTTVAAGASTTFDITFTPASAGDHTATVTILNNDCDEATYTFDITGYLGDRGETLNLDGIDDYAFTNINSSTDDFTLEAWFKADSGANGYRAIMVWQTTGPNKETSIEVRGTGVIRLGQYDYTVNRWQQVYSTTNVKDDQWHHVAAVKIGSEWTLYIDGVAEGTLTLASNNSAYTGLTDFRIGNIQFNDGTLGEHFRGEIDEVRIWDHSRSCYEIKNTKDCELSGTETGLVAYYDFNQGVAGGYNPSETVLLDQTANNYDATLSNFALDANSSNWIAPGSGISTTACIEVAPKISVSGNATVISDGDTTPDSTDGTAFGTISTQATATQTFTITNDGGGDLEIDGISVSGTSFSLGGSLTFPITLSAGMTQDFDVSFLSNSCTDTDYNGSVQVDTNDCAIGSLTYAVSASVTDDVNPTMVCQDITVQLDTTGNVTIAATDIDNGSSDACGIDTMVLDITDFDCTMVGNHTVELTVTDMNGNSNTCTATVTVQDTVDPTAVCQDITVQLDDVGDATIYASDIDGGSSDNCEVLVSFTGTPFISQTSFNNANNSRGHGQSFTATVTGVLTKVRVMLDRDYSGRNIYFYNGAGSGVSNGIGTPDYTEPSVPLVNSNGGQVWSEIVLTEPFSVVAGNTYAFVIHGNTDIYYAWSNAYTGGSFIWRYDTASGCCTWGDLAFELEFDEAMDFSCAETGDNTIPLLVTDLSGNTDTCNATVTVEDSVLPDVICQNITIQLDASGNASIVASDIDNGSSDACGIDTMVLDVTAFDCTMVGANTVELTVTDVNGNSDSCIAIVTVEDNIVPTVVCQDITVQLDASGNASIVASDINNGSSDVCGIDTMVLDVTAFDCTMVGANKVELIVTDVNGNSDSCNATVTVEDNIVPTVVCQDITVQLDASGNASIVASDIDNGSSDACGIDTMVLDITAFDCTMVGANTVELTVTDVNGNSDSCIAIVTVEDNIVPTVVCQDITVQLDASGNASILASDIDNGSSDACGIDTMVLDITAFDCTMVGANTVELTVTDIYGNSDSCNATVTVEDNIVPTVVCQDITVQLDASGNASILASDIDNGSSDACGIDTMVLDITAFDCTMVGANTVELTVTDVNGNSDSCNATVTVEDNIVPTVVCQDITVQLDASGNASIVASDIDNGSSDACGIDTMVLDITAFDCTMVGANTVELTVTDINGNSNTCMATITVEDSVLPTVVCQDITVQLDDTGNISITASDIDNGSSDACGVILSLDTTDFTLTDVGTNDVVLTATDPQGNRVQCTAIVTVEDVTPPIITLLGDDPQIISYGDSYQESGAITNEPAELVIGDLEYVEGTGDYIVRYNATDASGNQAIEVIREVLVAAKEAPEFNIQVYQSATRNEFYITGFDGELLYEIYDINGRRVRIQNSVTAGEAISVANYSVGYYFLKMYHWGYGLDSSFEMIYVR
ncbi:HYR domain-containing protein [Aquimarina pacifica]|uniref:HYR domain-containing protein n=1 Tax=Aquimarina pacifica TaxID=1296415 RepID=UPI0004701D4A|nr:HYR domain-containing protein [Aquimarina pacifica]